MRQYRKKKKGRRRSEKKGKSIKKDEKVSYEKKFN